MPEPDYEWLPRSDILDFDELERLTRAFASVGVDRVRLTGGEPLLRRDLPELVDRLAKIEGIEELALTTNGILLPAQGPALREAGLDRVTVSLDTLRAERFQAIAQRDEHGRVLRGIEAARELGFPVKLNAVVVRGFNEDEIIPLLEYAREQGAELRFIEYMDVGGATQWRSEQVVSQDEILATIERCFGSVQPKVVRESAPATRFVLQDGTVFGVIASTTKPFCATCDRARITADGTLLTCLYGRLGVDVRAWLRGPKTDEQIREDLARLWRERRDRGAEQRLGIAERAPLAKAEELRGNPHLEMHTRGG